MTREEQMQDMMTAAFWRDIEEGNQPDSADAIEIAKTYERAYQQGWKDADSYPNWIPVDERKPNDGQVVLIYSKGGDVCVTCYKNGAFNCSPLFQAINVTHWMEIVPPQGNDDKK